MYIGLGQANIFSRIMNIGIACGGTGGHIFPGLATAEALCRRGHAVVLWLAGKGVEQTAVAGWEGKIVTVPFSGFGGLRSWRAPLALWNLRRAIRQCKAAMRPEHPDVLLAMGSYASLAPVWAARALGIPVVLHEANVVPGRAIRFLSRWADAVAVGFEETRAHLRHRRLVATGMPLRGSGQGEGGRWKVEGGGGEGEGGRWRVDALSGKHEGASGQLSVVSGPLSVDGKISNQKSSIINSSFRLLQPDRFTLLVMGGSGGAHSLNEKASAAVIRLRASGKPVQAIHLAGPADEQTVRRRYEQAGVAHAVFGFCREMPEAYRRTSLAVCRSGASTCAELCRYGVAALLVPYPFAASRHQMANARALAATGAAEVRAEAELTVDNLAEYIAGAMADPDRLARLRQAARRRDRGDAAESLADLVERVGQERQAGRRAAPTP